MLLIQLWYYRRFSAPGMPAPWRFIDPEARFKFVGAQAQHGYEPTAGELRFERGGQLFDELYALLARGEAAP
jgi:hypothetical protein